MKSVIELLIIQARALRACQNDKTGVLTSCSKEKARKGAIECEQAIIVLNNFMTTYDGYLLWQVKK